jgi:ATP-dependent Lon protease
MIKDIGLAEKSIVFNDNIIENIIQKYTKEGGVRKLKSLLINIIRELNLSNLTKCKINNKSINFPCKVNEEDVQYLLRNKYEIEYDKIHKNDKVGVINGLYASSMGVGGVLPIEAMWIPASQALNIKATGSLEKVITESIQVACSLAWNYLENNIKSEYLKEWKEHPLGFHIHCPDGGTPKDGPSAGCAITLVIYSMLTNKKIKHDIAITGEINLQGNVTAIGGLEEKLEGAKRAGVKKVLFPKENLKDIYKIKERNPLLIDNNFEIQPIESFEESIKYALL